MQADHKEDHRDEVIPIAADVAQHPPRARRDRADRGDGDEDADRKQRRGPERPPGAHRSLFADEADNHRNARQVARTEHDAEYAPDESSADR